MIPNPLPRSIEYQRAVFCNGSQPARPCHPPGDFLFDGAVLCAPIEHIHAETGRESFVGTTDRVMVNHQQECSTLSDPTIESVKLFLAMGGSCTISERPGRRGTRAAGHQDPDIL